MSIETKEYITGNLYIMRGLSGSGKTHYIEEMIKAKHWPSDILKCSMDHYMLDKNGNYSFRDYKINEANELCYLKFTKAILDGCVKHIVIDNRNLQHVDFIKYYVTARILNYNVRVVSLYDGGKTDDELAERNIHDVPAKGKGSIAWSRKRWEGFSLTKMRKYILRDRIGDVCSEYTGYVEERFAEPKIQDQFSGVEVHDLIP